MNTKTTDSNLFKRLKSKAYRDRFVAGEIKRTIPFQLRALRAARELTQAQLGNEANMPQTVISRIENGNAASLSIKTLLKLASAFDVALVVRFEPIDRVIDWVDNLSPEAMSPRKSAEILAETEDESARNKQQYGQSHARSSGLAQLTEFAQRKQKADKETRLLAKTIGG